MKHLFKGTSKTNECSDYFYSIPNGYEMEWFASVTIENGEMFFRVHIGDYITAEWARGGRLFFKNTSVMGYSPLHTLCKVTQTAFESFVLPDVMNALYPVK